MPDAHDPSKRHAPVMLTTDLALRMDPIYEPISRRFLREPEEFADAFAKAWFKLTHRDMGPITRYLGPLVPAEPQLWQDPVPAGRPRAGRRGGHRRAQGADPRVGAVGRRSWSRPPGRRRRRSAAPTSAAAPTARASASRRRRTGTSTTRPSWRRCCRPSRRSSRSSTARRPAAKQVSLADLIVLGGLRGRRAGREGRRVSTSQVPFTPGRTDASQEQTDVESFAVLEPTADGFRNYLGDGAPAPGGAAARRPGAAADADRARDDRARRRPARPGREPRRVRRSASSPTGPESLTNDFFVNLLDMGTTWEADVRGRGDVRGPRPRDGRAAGGRPAASTSSSARTRSCARSPRSTRATTRRRSSCATSSPRGTRS